MTLKWMAARLKMGAWTHVANRLCHLKKRTCVNTQDPFTFTAALIFFTRLALVDGFRQRRSLNWTLANVR
jgi:hypothetical protein